MELTQYEDTGAKSYIELSSIQFPIPLCTSEVGISNCDDAICSCLLLPAPPLYAEPSTDVRPS
jgi:hypothetical protein